MGEGIIRQDSDGTFSSEIKNEGDIIPVRLNDQEKQILKECKKILEQPKDSTAIKMLMILGYKSITQPETAFILETIFENKRKNKRLGIVEYIA